MSRALLAGSWLNEIAGSTERWPAWRVLVWNPRQVTINELASGTWHTPPLDLSAYVESFRYSENVGYENMNNPSTTTASIRFRRNRLGLEDLRQGWVDDGVLVRIYTGDLRVRVEDWTCIFTGTFRGAPSDDPGTPSQLSEYMEVQAFGREERYTNVQVKTTPAFGVNTDVGEIALEIATDVMNLGQDEILMGAQGFRSRHVTNQIVDTNCLDALYQLLFVVGKKPKFDSLGRLCAVEADLDKPAARIYSAGDVTIEQVMRQQNEVEANNEVLLKGLSDTMEKITSAVQALTGIDVTTGFFDSEFKKQVYFSQDKSQRAQNTYLVTKHKIWFSDAAWRQEDEFHGLLDIDTHYLFEARAIIFGVYLASELASAALQYFLNASNGAAGVIVSAVTFGALEASAATEILALQIISKVALAALLWSMQFIGSGSYEVWGTPFEYVYRELQSRAHLPGIAPENLRTAEFRNDLLSTMDELDVRAKALLRRELVKNQLYQITMMDDPLLEVDDVIETADGSRYYVLTVDKEFRRDQKATMTLTCWKIFSARTAKVEDRMAVV